MAGNVRLGRPSSATVPMYSGYASEVRQLYPRVDFDSSLFNAESVPYYHVRHDAGHSCLTHQVIKDAADSGIKLRRGHFTPEEDGRIRHNWARLCNMLGLDAEKAEKYLWMRSALSADDDAATMLRGDMQKFICACLLRRTVRQIVNRARLILPSSYGRDCRTVDGDIVRHVRRHGPAMWNALSLQTGVHERYLSQRYVQLTRRPVDSVPHTLLWTGRYQTAYERAVVEETGRASIHSAAVNVATCHINWHSVGRILSSCTGIETPAYRLRSRWLWTRRKYQRLQLSHGGGHTATGYGNHKRHMLALGHTELLLTALHSECIAHGWERQCDVDWDRVRLACAAAGAPVAQCCDTAVVSRRYYTAARGHCTQHWHTALPLAQRLTALLLNVRLHRRHTRTVHRRLRRVRKCFAKHLSGGSAHLSQEETVQLLAGVSDAVGPRCTGGGGTDMAD